MKNLERSASRILSGRRFKLVRVSLAAVLAALAVDASADEYELGPQDRIRITVVEWTLDELRSPISGEYTVGAGGSISLPLLGTIPAVGMPISEFSASVSTLLQERLELSQRPNTSVEVVQFRPFYITGEITNAGEFAYRPGMTVLQAVSLAGGVQRSPTAPLQARRELIAEEAALAQSRSDVEGLLVRLARLEAELGGADAISSPEGTRVSADGAEMPRLIEAETTIFEARRASREQIGAAEAHLSAMFEAERQTLERHLSALQEQLRPAQAQLDMVRNLKDRGLASPTRELDIERIVADIHAKRMELETQGVRLQREFAAVQEANRRTESALRQETAREMRETTAQIADLRRRIGSSQDMIRLAQRQRAAGASARYTIMREDPADPSEALVAIAAEEHTRIKPGDVLEVEIDWAPSEASPIAALPTSASSASSTGADPISAIDEKGADEATGLLVGNRS